MVLSSRFWLVVWVVVGVSTVHAQGLRVDLLEPQGGEQMRSGTTLAIRWSLNRDAQGTEASLSYRLGVRGRAVPIATVRDQTSFSWDIPRSLSSNAVFLSVSVGFDGAESFDQTRAPLLIDGTPPTSRIVGARVLEHTPGGRVRIDLDAMDNREGSGLGRVFIWGRLATQDRFQKLVEVPQGLSVTFALDDGAWVLRAQAEDGVGNVEDLEAKEVQRDLVLDRQGPVLEVTPFTPGLVLGGEQHPLQWQISESGGGQGGTEVSIDLWTGSDMWPIAQGLPAIGAYPWPAPHVDLAQAKLVFRARDLRGNSARVESAPFRLQAYAPRAVLIGERSVRGGKGFKYRVINKGVLTVTGVDLHLSTFPEDETVERVWRQHEDIEVRAEDEEILYMGGVDWNGFSAVVRTSEGETDSRLREPAPEAGSEPEIQFHQIYVQPTVRFVGLAHDWLLRGGTSWTIRWDPSLERVADPARATVRIDYAPGGSPPWRPITEGFVANSGAFVWRVPEETHGAVVLRLSTRTSEIKGLGHDYSTVNLALDSEAPLGIFEPALLINPGRHELPYRVFDRGLAGVESVTLWTRHGSGAWRAFPLSPHDPEAAYVSWQVDLVGSWQLYLQGCDALGNEAPPPDQADDTHFVTVQVVQAAALTILEPQNPQRVNVGAVVNLRWRIDSLEGLSEEPFFLQRQSADDSWYDVAAGIARGQTGFPWRVPQAEPGDSIMLRLGVRDLAGGERFAPLPPLIVAGGSEVRAVVTRAARTDQLPLIVEYMIENQRPETQIEQVTLHYTLDGGSTWRTVATPDDNADSPLQWEDPPAPGLYGLSVTCVFDGKLQSAPKPGDPPQLADVRLDWIAPVCELNTAIGQTSPAFPVGTLLDLHWAVRDAFLDRAGTLLEYRRHGDSEWTLIFRGGDMLSGQTALTLPDTEATLDVRLQARDLDGHLGESLLVVQVVEPVEFPLLLDTPRRLFRGGEELPITWNVGDQVFKLLESPFRLVLETSSGLRLEIEDSATWQKTQKRYVYSVPRGITAAQCRFRLEAFDISGLSATAVSEDFTLLDAEPAAHLLGHDAFEVKEDSGRRVAHVPLRYTVTQGEYVDGAALPFLERLEVLWAFAQSPGEPFSAIIPADREHTVVIAAGPAAEALPPLVIPVTQEGVYRLWLVAVDRSGQRSRVPEPGDAPQHEITVDLGPPVTELMSFNRRAVYFTNTRLPILWRVRDLQLHARPISLDYQRQPGGPWVPIAVNLPNALESATASSRNVASGEYLWLLPEHDGRSCAVRVSAMDRRGAVTAAESAERFLILRPEFEVTVVEPATGAPISHTPNGAMINSPGEDGVRLPVRLRFSLERTIAEYDRAHPDDPLTEQDHGLIEQVSPSFLGPVAVRMHYRRQGERPYRAGAPHPTNVEFDAPAMVPFQPVGGDGRYEVFLTFVDRFGNTGAQPTPDSAPHAVVVIDTRPPVIHITNHAEWHLGAIPIGGRRLTWTAHDHGRDLPARSVKIQYSTNHRVDWLDYTDPVTDARWFSASAEEGVTVHLPPRSDVYAVRVVVVDAAGHEGSDEIARTFKVDADRPIARVLGPGYSLGLSFPVEYNAEDPGVSAGLRHALVYYRPLAERLEGRPPPPPVPWTIAPEPDAGAESPAVIAVPDYGAYELLVVAEDRAGNTSLPLGPGRVPAAELRGHQTVIVDPRTLKVEQVSLPILEEKPGFPLAAGGLYNVHVRLQAPSLEDVVLLLEYSLSGGRGLTWHRAVPDSGRSTVALERIGRYAATKTPAQGEIGPPHTDAESQAPLIVMKWQAPMGDYSEACVRVTAFLRSAFEGSLNPETALSFRRMNLPVKTEPMKSTVFAIDLSPPLVVMRPMQADASGATLWDDQGQYQKLLEKGNRHRLHHDWDLAVSTLERAIEENERDAEGFYMLARTLRERGADADAARVKALLDRALFLNDGHARAETELGHWHLAQSQYDPAIGRYRRALVIDAKDLEARVALGRCFYRRGAPGDIERARDQFSEALMQDSLHQEALEYYWAASSRLRDDRALDEAFEALARLQGAGTAAQRGRLLRRLEALRDRAP